VVGRNASASGKCGGIGGGCQSAVVGNSSWRRGKGGWWSLTPTGRWVASIGGGEIALVWSQWVTTEVRGAIS